MPNLDDFINEFHLTKTVSSGVYTTLLSLLRPNPILFLH